MSIVTATQVRATGNWETTDYTDAVLNATPFIPVGDAWLNQVCKANGYSAGYTGVTDAYKKGLLVGAECNFVAYLLVSQPQREDFKAGPVESADVKNSERVKAAENYWNIIKNLLGLAGFSLKKFAWSFAGGADYHPSGTDDTQIDFDYASETHPFDVLGGDHLI